MNSNSVSDSIFIQFIRNRNNIKKIPKKYKLLKDNIFLFGNSFFSLYEDRKTKKKILFKKRTNLNSLLPEFMILKRIEPYSENNFTSNVELYRINNESFGIKMEFFEHFHHIFDTFSIITKKNRIQIAKNLIHQLKLLHSLKISHNDLKTYNILVNPKNNESRIIDFDCAVIFENDDENYLYDIPCYTPGHFTLKPDNFYTSNQLKKNDMDTLSYILFYYVEGKKGTKKEIQEFKEKYKMNENQEDKKEKPKNKE